MLQLAPGAVVEPDRLPANRATCLVNRVRIARAKWCGQ